MVEDLGILFGQDLIAPLQRFDRLGELLGIELLVQRDDLLPFPLAGNKVRKIRAELASLAALPDFIITNGAIDSNHCRTVALFAAQLGIDCHLVLHGTAAEAQRSTALKLLSQLGAQVSVVPSDAIRATIAALERHHLDSGASVHIISGGAHSPPGAKAFATAGRVVLREAAPHFVFVASGTGATQGGLVSAATQMADAPRVIGISVARTGERGAQSVSEAAAWAGAEDATVEFDDRFRAGGYGKSDDSIDHAVALGWQYGLPLDSTYTGKAMAGLLDYARRGEVRNSRVLFWHTGGLWNHLEALRTAGKDAS